MTDTQRDQNQDNLGPDQHQGNRNDGQRTPDSGADKNQNPDQARNREQGDTIRKDDRQGIDPDSTAPDRNAPDSGSSSDSSRRTE